MGLSIEDPVLFRGAILLAAMHYSWICGSFKEIEETYLYVSPGNSPSRSMLTGAREAQSWSPPCHQRAHLHRKGLG